MHFPERASSLPPTSDNDTGDTTQGEPLQKAQGTMQGPTAESRTIILSWNEALPLLPGGFYNQYGLGYIVLLIIPFSN